eukprot:jgi/Picsp_1/806/NSC_04295-R1_protein
MILGYSCCRRRIGSERNQRAQPLGYASLRRCVVSWRNNINDRLRTNRALDADEGIESSALSLEVREVEGRMDVSGRCDVNGKEVSESSKGRVETQLAGELDEKMNISDSPDLSADMPVKRRRGRPRKSDKQESQDKEEPTELIFKLERRGYGWGEEIIPYLTVEKRPVKRKSSGGKKTVELTVADDPEISSEESILDAYLREIGVPDSEIERLVNSAVAWRTTPGGRPLIDRRRQSRLTRNVRIVSTYLVEKCNIPLGRHGVAAIFIKTPELMLCKPSNNDRWDRRAVELAAFLLQNGHCNVPEVYEENPELGNWVKRQRVSRASGQLSAERLTILERMGFEFGDLAQVTDEWETRFDQLVDWVLWHGEAGEEFSWDLIRWGERGGITARELALWICLQREFNRRQLLPVEAIQRFEAVYSGWIGNQHDSEDAVWMTWLGRLVYVIERRRLAMRRPPAGKDKSVGVKQQGENQPTRGNRKLKDQNKGLKSQGGTSSAALARNQVFNKVLTRRQAAKSAHLSEEDGLRYWISRQRWLWRKSRLHPERVKMLQLAGIDMDIFSSESWRETAHLSALLLQKDHIVKREDEFPFSFNIESSGKLQVLRWVETQRALFLENRLSPGQLRYMTFLGLTWLLSDKVVDSEDPIWLKSWKSLKDFMNSNQDMEDMPEDLQDWLAHQKSLAFLGLLNEERQKKLSGLNITMTIDAPNEWRTEWNIRLGQLLMHTTEVGHADVTEENSKAFPGLSSWLQHCKTEAEAGRLSAVRIAQLRALGCF